MRSKHYFAIPTLALTLSLLTSCAATPTADEQKDAQRLALSRWNECIERNLPQQGNSVIESQRNLEHACDGHKRDVLLVYPERLEKELDAYLVHKTRERAIKHLAVQAAGKMPYETDSDLLQAAIQ